MQRGLLRKLKKSAYQNSLNNKPRMRFATESIEENKVSHQRSYMVLDALSFGANSLPVKNSSLVACNLRFMGISNAKFTWLAKTCRC